MKACESGQTSMTMCLLTSELDEVLQSTAHLWENMRGQQIFVTGGTGFFGRWLAETFCYINRLLDLRAQATLLTRSPTSFSTRMPHIVSQNCIKLLGGDVSSFTFPDGEFRYVIHAATDSGGRQVGHPPREVLATMVHGMQRVLTFADSHGTRRLLLTSSGAVYGIQPPSICHLPESYMGAPDTLQAASIYGEGKRVSELLCTLACAERDLECAIARCWAFCGPHLPMNAHFAIGNFIGDALAGKAIRIRGDGTARRSYLYASDLVSWLWTLLFSAPSMIPINVGSNQDVSILELAETVRSVVNPHVDIVVTGKVDSGQESSRYVPSVERARSLLALTQTVSLRDAIDRTARWHRSTLDP